MKTCSKCGGTGPFPKDKNHRDGLASWCRACYRDYNHAYRTKNIDKELARCKAWHNSHVDKDREQANRWRKENPERYKQIVRRTRQKNAEHRLDAKRKRRALKYGVKGEFTNEQWKELKNEYDNRCVYCLNKFESLEPDHIIPISRNGPNDISNIVPACKSCNSSKQDKPLLLWMYSRIM